MIYAQCWSNRLILYTSGFAIDNERWRTETASTYIGKYAKIITRDHRVPFATWSWSTVPWGFWRRRTFVNSLLNRAFDIRWMKAPRGLKWFQGLGKYPIFILRCGSSTTDNNNDLESNFYQKKQLTKVGVADWLLHTKQVPLPKLIAWIGWDWCNPPCKGIKIMFGWWERTHTVTYLSASVRGRFNRSITTSTIWSLGTLCGSRFLFTCLKLSM
jgi:hypothetical protein